LNLRLLNNSLRQAYSPAYILVIILLTLLAVFLLYGIFNDYITTVFYEMTVDNGGDEQWAMFAVNWWQLYFIIAFVISMIIFVIVNAQRRED
jgi:uncharacterized membrane protein